MKDLKKSYRKAYGFVMFILHLFYRAKTTGFENIPAGAAIVCANHSNWSDPFIIADVFSIENQIRFMAKAELFRIPILGRFLRYIGSYPVSRGENDISAIRTSLRFLHDGEKIAIFPEGTRVNTDDAVAAKSGAVKMAVRAKVPIIPVYVPRNKRIFSRPSIVIGKPYYVNQEDKRFTPQDFALASDELMERIKQLKPVL